MFISTFPRHPGSNPVPAPVLRASYQLNEPNLPKAKLGQKWVYYEKLSALLQTKEHMWNLDVLADSDLPVSRDQNTSLATHKPMQINRFHVQKDQKRTMMAQLPDWTH